ncbi:hypothetical protein B0T17DRAFT_125016 [Bombardia bombarda]|uniref:Nephrocystin 3-like N-terminal domain-containing protein n=1 Tax=Bombardia bombarda TaxID=252184 RepID=A0AA39WBJ5_9PEZI|nr:hypothetical protein B0T17DRAFT_125016 [Bombardia bombarda]
MSRELQRLIAAYLGPEGLRPEDLDRLVKIDEIRHDVLEMQRLLSNMSRQLSGAIGNLHDSISAYQRRGSSWALRDALDSDYRVAGEMTPDLHHTNSLLRSAIRSVTPRLPPIPTPDVQPSAVRPKDAPNSALNPLSADKPDIFHRVVSTARMESSGQWIFSLAEFKRWRKMPTETDQNQDRDRNCLWCHGNLGAGKTVLMSAVIDNLTSEVAKDPAANCVVTYYYFARSRGCTSYDACFSLLAQLCKKKSIPLPRHFADAKAEDPNERIGDDDEKSMSGVRLGNLVASILSLQWRFRGIYICLDGLEECDDILTLFEVLFRLSSMEKVRLFMTARPSIMNQGIQIGIGRNGMKVSLEEHNGTDIRDYLQVFMRKHTSLLDIIGEKACPDFLSKLVEASGKNFLSAIAQVTQLDRFITNAEVMKYLQEPPPTFTEVFSLVLSHLSDQSPQMFCLAKRVFYWLSVARRPLDIREIQQAVAVELGASGGTVHTSLDIEDPTRLPPSSLIVKACKGFVHIDTKSDLIFTTPPSLPFYLYQFNDEFAREAREYAAVSCISLLQSKALSHGTFKSQTEYDKMQKSLPFANYVSQNWGVHLDQSEEETVNLVTTELLENEKLLETLSQLLHVSSHTKSSQRYDQYPTGFGNRHFASYFGLTAAFNKWAHQEDWKVSCDSWGRSPLHVCLLSPGLQERHFLINMLEPTEFSVLILADEVPELDTEIKDKLVTEDTKIFCHEPVEALPWKWSKWNPDHGQNVMAFRNSVMGNNLKTLVLFSEDDLWLRDKDGKTPIHHLILQWSEEKLLGFLQIFEYLPGSDDEDEGTSDSSEKQNGSPNSGISLFREQESLLASADFTGKSALDYACEKNAFIGSLLFLLDEWSQEQLYTAISISASCGRLGMARTL